MATLGGLELLYQLCVRGDHKSNGLCPITAPRKASSLSPKRPSPKLFCRRQRLCSFRSRRARTLRASLTDAAAVSGTSEAVDVLKKTFKLKRTERVEGKISIRIDREKNHQNWLLTVGCSLPGKWILHWGVSYADDASSEWDQPPTEMRPSGSIAIKDYAIETPLKKSPAATEPKPLYEVKISFSPRSSVAAIHFVLKDEETGAWYQHKGRDFKVPLSEYLQEDSNIVEPQKGFGVWSGALGSLVNKVYKAEGSESKNKEITTESKVSFEPKRQLEGIYEEQAVVKEVSVENSVGISVQKCPEKAKNLLYIETDAVGDVVLHWGVCRDNGKKWEIPPAPYPPRTTEFKKKALQTLLQPKEDGSGSWGMFTLNEEFVGFLFVLKLRESTWLNHMGNDFYIPLSNSISSETQLRQDQSENQGNKGFSEEIISVPIQISGEAMRSNDTVHHNTFTDGIIAEIRNLMSDISSEKIQKTKTEAEQVSILQEIEKLAAEAYSIFRSVTPTPTDVDVMESQLPKPPALVCSGTGSGFEILCQGFNWESHKSGKWFMELNEKAAQLSSLGFTIIWLPPPTESVSPEGYMPKDLYNLNSRYGSMDELKATVKCFHENGIKVLGDVVLNHRCAHYQNQNGVWNIFGGRLNWDDRAVVADDPHFQGRGNKSSGDNFHAAPNIDHSQDFVRKDIKEWLCWLREEIGYDGWRLDFVRGFWGGYVKDYLDASKPFFAVGEYWDSLNYTYGEMDHNQDAHRQRIIDWINATTGFAGAFDVTTKGILHSALQRCEYWRLSDQKGKPPGVVGWWPSRAVTFIENHDTGSTQGHWRFPRDKEMQGYAYILTHPGTPALFFDHIFSHYQPELATLISVRKRNELHCRSLVEIAKAERDVYGAIIDEKVAMKIGPGQYEPPGGSQRWSLAIEGRDYKVWEVSHE